MRRRHKPEIVMTSKSKVAVGILIAVLIMLVSVFILVDAVYQPEEEQVVVPQGELVESVFVAQNNEYVKNDTLPTTHNFETVPYAVDVPKGTGARIGTGTVYQVADGFFVYVSEYTDQYDVQDIISAQFPVALLINYVPESTKITEQAKRTGYINGFKATYIADSLYVTDGVSQAQALVLGYVLDMPDGTYSGNHLFIAVGTTTMTTDAANSCASVLSAVIKTVRYDEALNTQLVKDQEKAKEEAAKAEQEAMESMASEGLDNTPVETGLQIVGDEVTESIPIVVPENYNNFELQVNWTMNNPNAVLEFFLPDGQTYATPLSQSDYNATFNLTTASAGTYTLRIMNYQQCGEISTTVSGETIE